MLECKSLTSSCGVPNFSLRFVDRDMYMHHLGLGVGHKRDEHDGEPMEVDPLDLGVHNAPDRSDERADYDSESEIDRNTTCQDEEEEQEEDDSKEEDDQVDGDDEEHGGSENELEEDLGYDEL